MCPESFIACYFSPFIVILVFLLKYTKKHKNFSEAKAISVLGMVFYISLSDWNISQIKSYCTVSYHIGSQLILGKTPD